MPTIRGVVARLEWAHYVAATLEGYTVTGTPATGWALSAHVVQADAFKVAQRPLWFVAPLAHGAWEWPIESLTINLPAGRVSARLGKESHAYSLRPTGDAPPAAER